MPKQAYCAFHPATRLVCPRCIGKKGGKSTTKRHRSKLSRWRKKGGRPKKG